MLYHKNKLLKNLTT